MDQLLIDENREHMESELVDLGAASEETRGTMWGWPDGGGLHCWC